MAKTRRPDSDRVKKSTLYGVAAVCLAIGFFGGVVFSVFKSTERPLPNRPAPSAGVGDRSRELEALTRETAVNPDNVKAWVDLGNLYFDTNQYDKAIWAYRESIERDPNNPNVWTDLGVMYRRNGNPKEAVKAFDQAIGIDPKHEVSRFNKGIVLMHDLNDPDAAIQVWEALLRINPLAMGPAGRSVDEMVTAYKRQLQKQN